MNIIRCDRSYAPQVKDIFNESILNSTALYEYEPRTLQMVEAWFDAREQDNVPVIGLVNEKGVLMGFGSYGDFRSKPAYRYTVEHSLYVHKDYRGRGYGALLLNKIIQHATEQQYHCLVAGIDAANESSIRLHQQHGFIFCGRIHQVGYKFDRWLDLDFYQLLLPPSTSSVH